MCHYARDNNLMPQEMFAHKLSLKKFLPYLALTNKKWDGVTYEEFKDKGKPEMRQYTNAIYNFRRNTYMFEKHMTTVLLPPPKVTQEESESQTSSSEESSFSESETKSAPVLRSPRKQKANYSETHDNEEEEPISHSSPLKRALF